MRAGLALPATGSPPGRTRSVVKWISYKATVHNQPLRFTHAAACFNRVKPTTGARAPFSVFAPSLAGLLPALQMERASEGGRRTGRLSVFGGGKGKT